MKKWNIHVGSLFRGKRGVAACLVLAALMFGVVNFPAVIGASSTARQLPIYCVQRDQKLVSISFDAAWGDVIVRQSLGSKGIAALFMCHNWTSCYPHLPENGGCSIRDYS